RHRVAPEHGRAQDEAGDARLYRLCAPGGDVGMGGDDEQRHGAAMGGARARDVFGPGEALPRVPAELDLDGDDVDGNVAVEEQDDEVGAVLGGLDAGQIGGGDARLGVYGERDAERLGEQLGGERGAVLQQVDQDLVARRGHACSSTWGGPWLR